jgi:putative transposase
MPRHKRLNIPGGIYHVITRGLDGQVIFHDDLDRRDFIERLERSLGQTGCQCYAWSLMPNHFHLLVRTADRPLSDLLRKLLTGYAVSFNHRHDRRGYLFQNRYKSILCQEDAYFLELVRYIHLNPVRAEIVKDLGALDRYSWSGHAVLMGRKRLGWQARDEVLAHFSQRKREAVTRYRQFVADGMAMGQRVDLTGGGLRRSAGGWEGLQDAELAKEYWRGDERILGNGDFVDKALQTAEETLTRRELLKREGWDLQRLAAEVCRLLSVESADLQKKGRNNNLSHAKGLICYLGTSRLGLSNSELGRYFKMSQPSVSKAVQRGERFARENKVKLLS